jgi:hypothetical protein
MNRDTILPLLAAVAMALPSRAGTHIWSSVVKSSSRKSANSSAAPEPQFRETYPIVLIFPPVTSRYLGTNDIAPK